MVRLCRFLDSACCGNAPVRDAHCLCCRRGSSHPCETAPARPNRNDSRIHHVVRPAHRLEIRTHRWYVSIVGVYMLLCDRMEGANYQVSVRAVSIRRADVYTFVVEQKKTNLRCITIHLNVAKSEEAVRRSRSSGRY